MSYLVYANGKQVGSVHGDEFHKNIHSNAGHIRYSPPSIGFAVDSLERARNYGATIVKVIDDDTGALYWAHLDVLDAKGWEQDMGWGRQHFLSLGLFCRSRAGAEALHQQLCETEPADPQLSLF